MSNIMEYDYDTFNAIVCEEVDTSLANVYLNLAINKIMKRLCPFGHSEDFTLPMEYEYDVYELASRLYFRRGGEGEIQHSENGVARIYKSVDDEDILSRIVPYGKFI